MYKEVFSYKERDIVRDETQITREGLLKALEVMYKKTFSYKERETERKQRNTGR